MPNVNRSRERAKYFTRGGLATQDSDARLCVATPHSRSGSVLDDRVAPVAVRLLNLLGNNGSDTPGGEPPKNGASRPVVALLVASAMPLAGLPQSVSRLRGGGM